VFARSVAGFMDGPKPAGLVWSKNLDYWKVTLVVGLTLLIVIGFNALLFVSFRKGGSGNLSETLRRTAKTSRNPWELEDKALQQLSDEVAKLKEHGQESQPAKTQGSEQGQDPQKGQLQ